MRMKASLVLVLAVLSVNGNWGGTGAIGVKSVEEFNRKFRASILNTDHTAMLAMWAEDGVDLMPGEAPLLGKKSIATWLTGIETSGDGSRVSVENWSFMISKSLAIGHQSGLTNIRLCSPARNLRLKVMERLRSSCIVRKTRDGPSSRKCGMTPLTADLSEYSC